MPSREQGKLVAACACGHVTLEAAGAPIVSVICYCDDCQTAALHIEALPNAGPVQDPGGGTAFVAYRKDRVRTTAGAHLLTAMKLKETSATKRLVATCCNSAMVLAFDDSKHWVDVYRSRIVGAAPPAEMRICTKYKPGAPDQTDASSYSGYPLRFLAKLVMARLAMTLNR